MNIIEFAVPAALILAFVIALVLAPMLIPLLLRLKIGQTEREEGVQSHLQKAGTPTMGGIIYLIAAAAASLVFAGSYPKVIPVMLLTLGFGVIGFIDDFLKVVLKRSDGLIAWQKLLLQFVLTTVFVIYLLRFTNISLEMIIPFTSGEKMLDLGVIAIPFLYIVVLATVNGVNFTDGLDGLASSVTIATAAFFAGASLLKGAGVEPAACAVIGALMGFLCYNVFPAKVFMGDTGSLALGGFIVAMAYVMNMPLFIPIIGIIYAVELLSVAMQVSYFKLTGGKRIFKMTPIHHHFELCGWSEPKIVAVFTIITIVAAVVGFCAL